MIIAGKPSGSWLRPYPGNSLARAEQFRKGAQSAKAAGFDGVEIHGANGYLPL